MAGKLHHQDCLAHDGLVESVGDSPTVQVVLEQLVGVEVWQCQNGVQIHVLVCPGAQSLSWPWRPWAHHHHGSQIITVAMGHAHNLWLSQGHHGHAQVIVIVASGREWGPVGGVLRQGKCAVITAMSTPPSQWPDSMPELPSLSQLHQGGAGDGKKMGEKEPVEVEPCHCHSHGHVTITAARSSQWPWAMPTICGHCKVNGHARVVVIVSTAVT
ncbi:hypothetical protein F5148DRAFT_1153263 [Russula earlei]|uniref:Uncharacterized protein n=1 Tax=Russula earlei TaxID=71964 RepID=A0ACC0TWA6_9AGAM|nr:hypothetical protein F5148DRAFT_1153263 [Russula earlei]